jgi:hypothetical protein
MNARLLKTAVLSAALGAACAHGTATPTPTPTSTSTSTSASAPASAAEGSGTAWRSVDWGMTVEEVLKAFPGEAVRLDPEETLADGNTVAVAIDRYPVLDQKLRVRFVFSGGKLALVSLRTQPDRYAQPEYFAEVEKHLAAGFGGPGESSTDDNFIDLRQTRWRLPTRTADLKYIPGVVVILYYPAAG